MKFVPAEIRQQCIATIEGVEQNFGARVLSAEILPATGVGAFEGRGEDYMLRIAFLRRPSAYLEINGQTTPTDAYRREPNSPIALWAMDLKDALSMFHGQESMASAAVTPYMARWAGEMLVRNGLMESMAPKFAALGAGERRQMERVLDLFINEGIAFTEGRMPPRTPAAGQQPTPNTGFGFGFTSAAATESPQEQARASSLVARAYVAMAMKAQMASGTLPPVEALDWPQPMLGDGAPSLKAILANPGQYRAALPGAAAATQNYIASTQPATNLANGDLSSVFGVRTEAPSAPQVNQRDQWLSELSRGVANLIQTAEPATVRAGGASALATQTLVDSGLVPADEVAAQAPGVAWGAQQQPAPQPIAAPAPTVQAFM